MILISYDGSADAKSAIEQAGELMSGEPATVLTAWEPFAVLITHSSFGFGSGAGADAEEIDRHSRETADQLAREGAQLANDAGFKAEARTAAVGSTVADAILKEAEDVSARAVVMGSRGLTGIKSMLLGSVSHAVIHDADRPVMVVPSPEVAAERTRRRRTEEQRAAS
jgi:nucleotide-binding universal stress UspA family protein